jgi:hypothetical protein
MISAITLIAIPQARSAELDPKDYSSPYHRRVSDIPA